MTEISALTRSVEALIDDVVDLSSPNMARLPKAIEHEISVRPEWAIDLIQHLNSWDHPIHNKRTKILLSLIEASLHQIRYSVDRKDKKGLFLLRKLQEELNQIIPVLSSEIRFALNHIIFDAKLSIDIEEDNTPHPNTTDVEG